jgi:hypothetical protein
MVVNIDNNEIPSLISCIDMMFDIGGKEFVLMKNGKMMTDVLQRIVYYVLAFKIMISIRNSQQKRLRFGERSL